ncbi:ABC transporter [Amylibacter ulvae]|uniref:ABC transporter n=1 Tax=Paramylibacter ulvae TaxID=1651968 RepID=A0ABQ3D964_9RHOB|nr:ABC transporter substrate-binding protein [Amylibacter ulvae]GHA59361.1 ABC transporter [Amylibacter ulvae]
MQTNNNLNRRGFIIAGSATVLGTAAPSFAISSGSAESLVNGLVAEVLKTVNASMSDNARFAKFEQIFARYADVPLIARKSLGPAYQSASKSQQAAYVDAFKGYMARSYGGRYFKQFIGAEIKVTKSKKISGGYLVDSSVKTKGGTPFLTQWHVIDARGTDKMYNIFVEGVSILTDTRTQIGSMLDSRGGNIDKLIAYLKTAR